MENSNTKAMRDALVEIDELTNLLDIPEDKKHLLVVPSHSFVAVKTRKIIKKALEEPPRNCDVGTAMEQCVRHAKWCNSRAYVCLVPKTDRCKACFAKWGQMPYAESEVKL